MGLRIIDRQFETTKRLNKSSHLQQLVQETHKWSVAKGDVNRERERQFLANYHDVRSRISASSMVKLADQIRQDIKQRSDTKTHDKIDVATLLGLL